MLRPLGWMCMKSASMPQSANTSGAMPVAAPLAQSTSTRSLLKSVGATSVASHSAYCSRRSWRAGQHLRLAVLDRLVLRRQLLHMGKDLAFDLVLNLVRELISVGAKNLDAIVLPGIVRSGDHDAGVEVVHPREIGNARSGDHAGADHLHASGVEARRQDRAIQALDSRVSWPTSTRASGRRSRQTLAERTADGVHRLAIQGIFAGDAANAVGAEKLSRVGRWAWRSMFSPWRWICRW